MISKYTAIALISLVIIVLLFYGAVIRNHDIFGFDPDSASDQQLPLLRILLTIVALIFGIIFGSCHRIWRERKEPMSLGAIKSALVDAELWRSLLVAPLAFSGVYVAARTQPDYIVAFFFAFQSGFFSDAIMQGKNVHDQQ
jgi:hypothetical protein